MPLVDAQRWTFVEPADDALWPPDADAKLCTRDDIKSQAFGDDVALEVDTTSTCGHATVEQQIVRDIPAGASLRARIFYFSQTTFPAAEAGLALALDDVIVWSERVAIPSTSGLLQPEISVARALPAGTRVHFHVGNHGDNSWNLIELSWLEEVPCPADVDGGS